MKPLWLFPVVLMSSFAIMAPAQEHAPSKAQCDADFHLWSSGFADATEVGLKLKDDKSVDAHELLSRTKAMYTCVGAYPDKTEYTNLADAHSLAYAARMGDFLTRHPDLLQKFFEEDAAGMR